MTRLMSPIRTVGAALLAVLPLMCQTIPIILTSSLQPATVGTSYSATLAVTGGLAPYTWSATGTLPPGLHLTSSGTFGGTPTALGTYYFTVHVMDARSGSASRALTITVGPATFSISTASPLPEGVAGRSYTHTLTATGGALPYQWVVSPGFPPGLTLDAQTGVIAGTPAGPGTFTFTVQATDSNQSKASSTLRLTIAVPPVAITTTAPLFTGTTGTLYAQTFTAAGGKPPYTWTVASGDTGGLTLDAASGSLQGTPQSPGTFNFVLQVTDRLGSNDTRPFSVVVNDPILTIAAGAALPPGTAGILYSQKLPVVANGGTPPYRWSLTAGASWLTLEPATMTISGTPPTAGSYSLTIQVVDFHNQTSSKSLTLSIAPPTLTITTTRQLDDGSLSVSYNCAVSATGGAPPYTWSAVGLPLGLTLNSSTGVISGVAEAVGTFAVAVTVTDTALTHTSDRFTLRIKLPATPTVTIAPLPQTVGPAEQYPVNISLGSTFPAPITGQAILSFTPETGPTDRTIRFASGSATATFNVPAGSTTPVADAPLAFQTGTVAGTISISLRLQAGGVDITPSPAPAVSFHIARAAPVIASVEVKREAGKLTLVVSGYSTAREVTEAKFHFVATDGQSLQASATSISVPVESLFGSWFQDPANSPYGSQFVLTQPFAVQGDAAAVTLGSVTLTNRVGSTDFKLP